MNDSRSSCFQTYSCECFGRFNRDPQVPTFQTSLGVFSPANSGVSSVWFSHLEVCFFCTEVCFCAIFVVPIGEQPDVFRYISYNYANLDSPVIFAGSRFPQSVLVWGLGGGGDSPTVFRFDMKRRLTSRDHLVFCFAFPDTGLWSSESSTYSLNASFRYAA
jgi:hypothetical protein